jgi:hypothetical protein
MEKRILDPPGELNSDPSVVQPVASRYTGSWARFGSPHIDLAVIGEREGKA